MGLSGAAGRNLEMTDKQRHEAGMERRWFGQWDMPSSCLRTLVCSAKEMPGIREKKIPGHCASPYGADSCEGRGWGCAINKILYPDAPPGK